MMKKNNAYSKSTNCRPQHKTKISPTKESKIPDISGNPRSVFLKKFDGDKNEILRDKIYKTPVFTPYMVIKVIFYWKMVH